MNRLKRGFLIAIEGIDGSGKSTLAANLFALANQRNLPVILTKEPGSTPLGKQLRQIVQTKEVAKIPVAEFLLFAADRAQHVHEVIKPALKDNKLIITDRMADSSLIYQGYGRGLSLDMINSINQWVLDGVKPELTIYVRIDIDTAWQRILARNEALTAFEQEKREFTQRLINGFDTLYKNRTDVIIIDGKKTPEQITQETWELLQNHLPQ